MSAGIPYISVPGSTAPVNTSGSQWVPFLASFQGQGGALIGGYFFGPIGAAVGGQLGTQLATLLDNAVFNALGFGGSNPKPAISTQTLANLRANRASGVVPLSTKFVKHHPEYLSHHPMAREI
jgi:hypothetical protein